MTIILLYIPISVPIRLHHDCKQDETRCNVYHLTMELTLALTLLTLMWPACSCSCSCSCVCVCFINNVVHVHVRVHPCCYRILWSHSLFVSVRLLLCVWIHLLWLVLWIFICCLHPLVRVSHRYSHTSSTIVTILNLGHDEQWILLVSRLLWRLTDEWWQWNRISSWWKESELAVTTRACNKLAIASHKSQASKIQNPVMCQKHKTPEWSVFDRFC